MKLGPRYLLFGVCLSLTGASPAREKAWPAATSKATPCLAVEEDGRLSLQAAGRRFEFGEGRVAVSARGSSWTYRFQGSRGGIRALSTSSRPEQTNSGSVEYKHAEGIVERYLVQSSGVEQQFVLPGPYAGGDILLTGSIATDLVPDKTSSFEGIAFRRGEHTVLFYGAAKAVDAAGKTALVEERCADGELTLVVPGSFLATVRFPVLVDPYIGTRADVDTAVDLAQNPAVASTGNALFKALAVWSTDSTSPQSIRGRIIGPRGNTLVGPISVVDEISDRGVFYTNPRVAWDVSGGVWVVAAVGHDPFGGSVNPNFIQVNQVDTAGTKIFGGSRNGVTGDLRENDLDVACNYAGLCLITWLVDRDGNATLDSVKGLFYTPSANTFGPVFSIFDGFATRSHSRVASNGTDFYEVDAADGNFIEGFSVTSGGTVVIVTPSQTSTATEAHPDVSYNSDLAKYLVAWDTGNGNNIRSTTLSSATPPVPSGSDAPVVVGLSPQIAAQEYMGWSMAFFELGGALGAIGLVRPNLSFGSGLLLDAVGATPSADVAHFWRDLSIVVYEDGRGSATDHDILAREFRTQAIEYADFDNNGWASAFVWRPGGNAYFYYNNDLFFGSPPATSVQFGTTGDIPVRTDIIGKGTPDLTVFRPSTGHWYIDLFHTGTANGFFQFGGPGDIPVPGDYDGDGLTDIAVFRPSNGTWYIRFTAFGETTSIQFGTNGDIPVPADYNGDFRTDIAVWRPSNGFWYVDLNAHVAPGFGTVDIQAQFGTAGDIPVPGDYGPTIGAGYPDGAADFAVFRPSTGYWYVSRNRDGVVSKAAQFGTNGDIPVGGIYDNDPAINSPFAVFRPSNGTWYVDLDNLGTVNISAQFGAAGDIPMQQPSGQYRN